MSNHVFLICTHGRFGEELIKSAEMIGGQLKNVYAFSLLQGVEHATNRGKAKRAKGTVDYLSC